MGNNAKNPLSCKLFVTRKTSQQQNESYQGIKRGWFDLQQSRNVIELLHTAFYQLR